MKTLKTQTRIEIENWRENGQCGKSNRDIQTISKLNASVEKRSSEMCHT